MLKDLFTRRPTTPPPPSPLHLDIPQRWDALSTPQLEEVSRILIDRAKHYTQTGEYSEADLLTRLFLYLSGLRVTGEVFIDQVDEETPPNDNVVFSSFAAENRTYTAEFIDDTLRVEKQTYNGEIVPIRLTTSDLFSLIHRCDWLLKPSDRTLFPYPTLTLPDPFKKNRYATITFQGPNLYCDGMTWAQYRILCDFMQALAQFENGLVTMQKNPQKYAARIEQQQKAVADLRAGFLATLFLAKTPHIDRETGQQSTDYFYYTSQCEVLKPYFKDFPEHKFQCISLWWQGQMHYLSRQFPKVFRSNKLKTAPDPNDDPLKLYTRSTTTMIKYAAESEEEVNRTTYTIILQHLNDMADENDRLKEIQHKH